MWEYGWHYHVEIIYLKRLSFGCGVMVYFKQSIRASSKDKNIFEGNLQYVGKIEEIIELDYQSFKCCVFKCIWYVAFERTQRHDTHSGLFSIDYLRYLPKYKEPGIILDANFSPVGYFSMFFSQKQFAILHFLKPCFTQFDGVNFFHPKNCQIII